MQDSNNDSKFFKVLKKKLSRNVSPDFDNKFWKNFEEEFPNKKMGLKELLNIKIVFPSMAAVLIISGLVVNYQMQNEREFKLENSPLVSMAPILGEVNPEDLELLSEMESIELSEEEWEILLGDAS
jgi:hypothetical protein